MSVSISQADLGAMLAAAVRDHGLSAPFVASLVRRHFAALDDYDKRQVLTQLEIAVAVPRSRFHGEAEIEEWRKLAEEIRPPKAAFTVDYHCHKCKARGLKLWRGVHGCADDEGHELLCAACLAPGLLVDDAGFARDDGHPSDQVRGWLPAVPVDDTFWGYGSVPTADVRWWRALPTYAPLPIGTGAEVKR